MTSCKAYSASASFHLRIRPFVKEIARTRTVAMDRAYHTPLRPVRCAPFVAPRSLRPVRCAPFVAPRLKLRHAACSCWARCIKSLSTATPTPPTRVIMTRCPMKAEGRTLTHLATERERRWAEAIEGRYTPGVRVSRRWRSSTRCMECRSASTPNLSGRKCRCAGTGAW
jgi:hypothetical protein